MTNANSNTEMNLNKKIAVGAAWSVVTRLAIKSLGFISTIILARLLFPEDFGLVALAMVMVAFFEVFANFSFDINIIQKDKHEVNDGVLNSAWTCKVLSGAILATLLVVASPLISAFFEEARLNQLILAISLIPLIKSSENIGFVLYRKELDLKKEFKLEVTAKLVSFTATIVSAYLLRNYWALVIGMYVNAISRVTLSYLMHSYRPWFSLSHARELFSFSKWLLLNNLLLFFNHKITDLVVGSKTSPTQLGYYSISYEVSNLATTELVFPLSRAIFPGYAKVKNDLAALRTLFLKVTGIIVFFATPICFGLASVSYELTSVFLGEKWLPVAPLIALLAYYGAIRCAVQNVGSVYVALAMPKIPVFLSIFRLAILVPLLLIFVDKYEVKGAVYAILITASISSLVSLSLLTHFAKVSVSSLLKVYLPPLIMSIMMVAVVMKIAPLLVTEHVAVALVVKALVGAVTYVSLALLYQKTIDENFASAFVFNKVLNKITRTTG